MGGLFSKFVIKEKKDDVVHSSGYGVAQNGGALGASSGVSFSERMRINNNRSRVKKYGDSKIANQFQTNYSGASTFDRSDGDAKLRVGGGDAGKEGSKYSALRKNGGGGGGAGTAGVAGAAGGSKYSTLRRGGSTGSLGGVKGR